MTVKEMRDQLKDEKARNDIVVSNYMHDGELVYSPKEKKIRSHGDMYLEIAEKGYAYTKPTKEHPNPMKVRIPLAFYEDGKPMVRSHCDRDEGGDV